MDGPASPSRKAHRRRPAAWLAAIATFATALTYVVLIVRQSGPGEIDDPGLVTLVTGALIGLGGLAAVGALAHDRTVRRASLVAATLGLFVIGFLALFSIGLLLLIAGMLAAFALIGDRGT